MVFDSWAEFFAMGTHGPYVWTCYIAVLLVFIGNWLNVRMALRARFAQLQWQASSLPKNTTKPADANLSADANLRDTTNEQSKGDPDLGDAS